MRPPTSLFLGIPLPCPAPRVPLLGDRCPWGQVCPGAGGSVCDLLLLLFIRNKHSPGRHRRLCGRSRARRPLPISLFLNLPGFMALFSLTRGTALSAPPAPALHPDPAGRAASSFLLCGFLGEIPLFLHFAPANSPRCSATPRCLSGTVLTR